MKDLKKRFGVLALTLSALFTATGCFVINSSHAGERWAGANPSLKGTACELARGATNVAFCWLEVPREVEARIRDGHVGSPFSIISNTFDVAFGTLDGAFKTAGRAAGGAVEVGLSPFPPYDPLMDPPYPPYLKFAEASEDSEREVRVVEQEQMEFDRIEGVHTQTVVKEMAFRPGGSLSVTTSNGSITVSSWDEPEIRIEAEKRMNVRSSGINVFGIRFRSRRPFRSVEEAERYFADLEIGVSGDENDMEVTTRYPRKKRNVGISVSYEVRMPRDAKLTLRTSNGTISVADISGTVRLRSSNGRVACEHVTGSIEASTSNGRISLVDVAGRIDVGTSNGSVTIVHSDPLDESESIIARTSNGSIKLSLPETSSFELEARTSNGRISTDFSTLIRGNISKTHVSGTVGHGGPKVKLTTSNGSISIRPL